MNGGVGGGGRGEGPRAPPTGTQQPRQAGKGTGHPRWVLG